MHAAGVRIHAGTDTQIPFLVPGAALHRELALLVEAGWSPTRALQAATWDNSRFLDRRARFGSIQAGWEADLLLVEGDPTQGLEALEDIVAVWTDGQRVPASIKLRAFETVPSCWAGSFSAR